MVTEPTSSASPTCLLEMQMLGSRSDLLHQHFIVTSFEVISMHAQIGGVPVYTPSVDPSNRSSGKNFSRRTFGDMAKIRAWFVSSQGVNEWTGG